MAKQEIAGAKKILSQMPEAVKMGIIHHGIDGEYEYSSGKMDEDLVIF